MATPATTLLCIDCSSQLGGAVENARVTCGCGLLYSVELLDQADVELWERARTERLFRRDGDTIIMTTPLEAIASWPCCPGMHGRLCEPPSELCCDRCSEAAHPAHRDGSVCSAPDLSAP